MKARLTVCSRIRTILIATGLTIFVLPHPDVASGAGISVDAGLTPAEDRWILRAQVRFASRGDESSLNIQQLMFPVVLAYGVRSDLSFFVRQMIVRRERTVSGDATTESGFGDTYLFAKYRAYRLNSQRLTLGLAPTLGVEFPTGEAGFTSDTWDLKGGLYASTRTRTWSSDLNVAYAWNDMAGDARIAPGDELSVDAAAAYQFVLDSDGDVTLSPVCEVSYVKAWPGRIEGRDAPNTGETVVFVSPGAKLATSAVILESLLRIPVHEDHVGDQMDRDPEALFGIRVLF